MKPVGERARAWAERILEEELRGVAPQELTQRVEHMLTRLRGMLINLVGPRGFQAVLTRAAYASAAECPALEPRTIEVDLEAVMQNVNALIAQSGEAQGRIGARALLTNVLDVLCDFIGEDLTLRFLNKVWPEQTS